MVMTTSENRFFLSFEVVSTLFLLSIKYQKISGNFAHYIACYGVDKVPKKNKIGVGVVQKFFGFYNFGSDVASLPTSPSACPK
jgi:hypothetical protein